MPKNYTTKLKKAAADTSKDTPKFKVSKYAQSCYYCRRKILRKSFIIKFNAEMDNLGVGICDTRLPCQDCGQLVNSQIDTWWGGTFKNGDTIFGDTAKKESIKVENLPDYSAILAKEHVSKLSSEVLTEERSLKNKKQKLEKIRAFLNKDTKK